MNATQLGTSATDAVTAAEPFLNRTPESWYELQRALTLAAADLRLCARWFQQANRVTDADSALNMAKLAELALLRSGL
jgi:hypothetical protein